MQRKKPIRRLKRISAPKPIVESPTGKLSKFEQETIIRFDRGNESASLFTYSKSLQNHMKSLGAEIANQNSFGGVEFLFPKSWVRRPLIPRNARGDE